MNVKRRSLLQSTLAFGAGAIVPAASAATPRHTRRPRNVIFCVADGMAVSVPTMLDQYCQIVDGRRSYWSELFDADDAVTGLQATRSLNSLVTDSSAAASAWGCGRHIWNSQVNVFPDGTALRTLTSLLTEKGALVGLVTTARITHATPSGFAINHEKRDDEDGIAAKHLTAGVHTLLGGGAQHFDPAKRKDKRDLASEFARGGWNIVRDRDSLIAAPPSGRLLGLFAASHIPYTIDREHTPAQQKSTPTLAEMAQIAIGRLSKAARHGFLLQIEGARVDMAGHQNDIGAMLHEQMAFEDAVKVAVDFARQDGETLVIITADHSTGGPALNGAGTEYIDSTGGLLEVRRMTASYDIVLPLIKAETTSAQIQELIFDKLGVGLTTTQADAVRLAKAKKSPLALDGFHSSIEATLSAVIANTTKVGWTSINHTSDNVLVTAVGPGREFVGGLTPNVRFFDRILDVWDIKWSNPTMDFATAKRFMAAKKVPLDAGTDRLHD